MLFIFPLIRLLSLNHWHRMSSLPSNLLHAFGLLAHCSENVRGQCGSQSNKKPEEHVLSKRWSNLNKAPKVYCTDGLFFFLLLQLAFTIVSQYLTSLSGREREKPEEKLEVPVNSSSSPDHRRQSASDPMQEVLWLLFYWLFSSSIFLDPFQRIHHLLLLALIFPLFPIACQRHLEGDEE